MKKFFTVLLLLIALPAFALAETVCLSWSPNSEPDLAGYRAFVRDWNGNYSYANPVWEGTETTCCIEGLNEAKLPHFVVRAFDAEGFESVDSNEVYLSNGPPVSPGSLHIIPQGN